MHELAYYISLFDSIRVWLSEVMSCIVAASSYIFAYGVDSPGSALPMSFLLDLR